MSRSRPRESGETFMFASERSAPGDAQFKVFRSRPRESGETFMFASNRLGPGGREVSSSRELAPRPHSGRARSRRWMRDVARSIWFTGISDSTSVNDVGFHQQFTPRITAGLLRAGVAVDGMSLSHAAATPRPAQPVVMPQRAKRSRAVLVHSIAPSFWFIQGLNRCS